jgi:hypothetical protein
MDRIYGGLSAEAIRARSAALARFTTWEYRHAPQLSAEAALAGVASLYELLPPASRSRPVDTRGVSAMHLALSGIGRARG